MQRFFVILALSFAICNGLPTEERKDNIDERGPFFQGDIVFPPGTKAGIIPETYRWPNGVVPYTLSTAFTASELSIIRGALDEISSKTCITFKQRTTESNYVAVQRGAANSGCWSYVGRLGTGAQQLNLQAPGCVYHGIVAHEFIHAIGFYHEQSRTDRDEYVTINWGNIQQGTEHNFDSYPATQVDPFGVAYDYGSVMHYSAYSFAIDPSVPTIIPKDPNASIGQRVGLSDKDAQKLKNMYKC